MNVIFHVKANLEIQTAADWFDAKAGLGSEFSAEIHRIVASVESNPDQFSPAPKSRHEDNVRVAMVRRFKYSIYFKVYPEASCVFVVAVQHGHRHPRHWLDRVSDFNLSEEEFDS